MVIFNIVGCHLSLDEVKMVHHAGAYPSFCSMKQLGVFLLILRWDVSSLQGYPRTKFAWTHLYSWVERGTVRVECLAQEHYIISQARTQTWIARSGCRVKPTTSEATMPPPLGTRLTLVQPLCSINSSRISTMSFVLNLLLAQWKTIFKP